MREAESAALHFDFYDRKVDRKSEPKKKRPKKPAPERRQRPENGQSIGRRWEAFHRANPDVFEAIRAEADRERAAGWKRISINLIFELLRRDPALQPAGGGDWKLNNNFRALYARELIRRYPIFDGLIEIRD